MKWRDLRDWLRLVDELGGELRVVRGANWERDIGRVTEMLDHTAGSPCVLFDAIPGYPDGHRVVVNTNGTIRRQAVTLGLDPATVSHGALMTFWRTTLRGLEPIPPRDVGTGPILENVKRDGEVDLNAFPAPVWHPKDGGRYIGTASLNIVSDPDSEWVNVGSYRNQILDANHLGLWISPGKHGRIIREKYFQRAEPFPIVVVVGSDPLLFMAACSEAPSYGMSEFGWAGAVRGEPIEVVRGELSGLAIPANAEIAFEGFVDPTERRPEGPYGEAYGYYSALVADGPFVEVRRVYHRNEPIILGCPQGKPPHEDNRFGAYLRSCSIWDQVEQAGPPDRAGHLAGSRGGLSGAIRDRGRRRRGHLEHGRRLVGRADPLRSPAGHRVPASDLERSARPGHRARGARPQLARDHRRDDPLGVAGPLPTRRRGTGAREGDPRKVGLAAREIADSFTAETGRTQSR